MKKKKDCWKVPFLEGALTVCLISCNFSFILCGAFDKKEIVFLRIKNKIMLPLKIVNTPLKFKNQDLHDLPLETHFWITLCLEKN